MQVKIKPIPEASITKEAEPPLTPTHANPPATPQTEAGQTYSINTADAKQADTTCNAGAEQAGTTDDAGPDPQQDTPPDPGANVRPKEDTSLRAPDLEYPSLPPPDGTTHLSGFWGRSATGRRVWKAYGKVLEGLHEMPSNYKYIAEHWDKCFLPDGRYIDGR